MNGSRHIRHDLSLVVEELLEEQDEYRKRAEEGARTPVLQMANHRLLPTAPSRCSFDVNFEIHQGECVALLGTNGAGKSTILRVVSGLEVTRARRVRLNGRKHHLRPRPSSAPAWASCSSRAARVCSRASPSTRTSRSARGSRAGHAKKSINGLPNALELFPELAERRKQPARSLSGGQQQMLALARVLMHGPQDPA